MPQVVSQGGWVGTMADVGGRVREGKPPKLWFSFGHGPKTPATGAVDLSATCIPPGPMFQWPGVSFFAPLLCLPALPSLLHMWEKTKFNKRARNTILRKNA